MVDEGLKSILTKSLYSFNYAMVSSNACRKINKCLDLGKSKMLPFWSIGNCTLAYRWCESGVDTPKESTEAMEVVSSVLAIWDKWACGKTARGHPNSQSPLGLDKCVCPILPWQRTSLQ